MLVRVWRAYGVATSIGVWRPRKPISIGRDLTNMPWATAGVTSSTTNGGRLMACRHAVLADVFIVYK